MAWKELIANFRSRRRGADTFSEKRRTLLTRTTWALLLARLITSRKSHLPAHQQIHIPLFQPTPPKLSSTPLRSAPSSLPGSCEETPTSTPTPGATDDGASTSTLSGIESRPSPPSASSQSTGIVSALMGGSYQEFDIASHISRLRSTCTARSWQRMGTTIWRGGCCRSGYNRGVTAGEWTARCWWRYYAWSSPASP